MYQAITTKFLGPTNTRGSRVRATAQAGSVTVHWDHALNCDANHDRAAEALAKKFGWYGAWFGGGLERGSCYVWVPSADADSKGVAFYVRGE
ncbi:MULTISPECIES: hypothetical protein [unclassified Shinella]|uniref:hypothetical protein n=1 Tax=unclassified Shinella TaxID=2643062 RepID=UPI00225CE51B|nr:conserved hypothetical protein [Rhizobiaceae bacterium]CAK7259112.1 conserved protein of unknown function [Shinella sp. WSC3-e]